MVFAALFGAALLLGVGSAPAHAATTPPTLKLEVIGMGTVTGTGLNCGLGALTCYSAYGTAGQSVTLTAAPSNGWQFDHWEDGASGAGCTTSLTCAMPVPSGDNTATAVFKTTSAVPTETFGVSLAAEHGAVTNSSGNYPIDCAGANVGTPPTPTPTATECSLTTLQGSTLTIVEQPETGFFFGGWGGACSGTGVSCAVYLSANVTATANFISSSSQPLTVTVTGNGTVTGGGISCSAGATCDAPQPPNSTVTLTASPHDGYAFTGWGNACSGMQTTCTVQMDDARTVTAAFAPLVPLSVTVSGTGSVSGGGIGCNSGQTCTANEAPSSSVTLTAAPSNAGGVVFWSGCTSASGTLCTVSVGTSPLSVTATFSGGTPPPVATFSLHVTVTGDGYVTSSGGSANIYCTTADGPGCTANVPANTSLTLTAIPASGSSGAFTSWGGSCSAFASTTCTITMTGAANVQATFAGGNTTYLLNAQAVGNGRITGAGLDCSSAGGSGCTASQAASANVTVTATPSFGTTFTGWSGGVCSGTTPTCTVSMTQARSVIATFATASATAARLTTTVSGVGAVKATGSTDCVGTAAVKSNTCAHDYTIGAAVSLTAAPTAGYVFGGWTGACIGKKKTCEVSMTMAKTVGAIFTRPALVATKRPTIAKTSRGFRVTLHFAAAERGTLKLVAKRATKTVARRTTKVAPGKRKLTFTVARSGRYIFTLTLGGKHALAWRVKIAA